MKSNFYELSFKCICFLSNRYQDAPKVSSYTKPPLAQSQDHTYGPPAKFKDLPFYEPLSQVVAPTLMGKYCSLCSYLLLIFVLFNLQYIGKTSFQDAYFYLGILIKKIVKV